MRVGAVLVAAVAALTTLAAPAAAVPAPRSGGVPDAPVGFAASARPSAARLTWEAPVPNGTGSVTGYQVQQRRPDGSWDTVVTTKRSARAVTVSGLTNGATYRFRIAAVSAAGRGDWSGIRLVRPPGVARIVGGDRHTCALMRDGTARCWGRNFSGELGTGSTTDSTVPRTVIGAGNLPLGGIEQIVAGGMHTCALLDNGTARCWGDNAWGQIGDGTRTARPRPTVVTASGSNPLTGITSLSAGARHTCAVLADATARCWGDNASAQIGSATTVAAHLRPTTVMSSDTAPLTTVTRISAGARHTCAIVLNGTARCWGDNDDLQLGDGTSTLRRRPTVVKARSGVALAGVVDIAAGDRHTCAVMSDETARCWGANDTGTVGDGSTTARRYPAVVEHANGTDLTAVAAVEAGGGHSCARIRGGTAVCWGSNADGRLGDTSTIDRTRAVTVHAGPTTDLAGVVNLATGTSHSCAVVADGTARCWGRNSDGQVGNASIAPQPTPVRVIGL